MITSEHLDLFPMFQMSTAADVFALFLCIISMIFKAALLLVYRRLPVEQKNTHFWFYIVTSFCFAVVSFIVGVVGFVSPRLLVCSFFPTVFIFMLFESLSDTCLIGYALSFFPGYNSFMLLLGSLLAGLVCTSIKLILIYNPNAVVVDSCYGTFVSSREGVLAAIGVELVFFVVLLLLATSVYIHKFKEDRIERAFYGRKCVMNMTLVGGIAVMVTAIFGVIEYETIVSLLKYNYLTIIYSIESCIICIAAVVSCPITWSSITAMFPYKMKKAKVDTMPRQQLYCSMSLRNPHPQKKKVSSEGAQNTPTETGVREESVSEGSEPVENKAPETQ
ncbi:hypothetical protein Y032_0219g2469 [Ancylostoma ceylanicum]|nr:hypothetical protein Y032_0219g2469 [Ancylostoma ceylanicum]